MYMTIYTNNSLPVYRPRQDLEHKVMEDASKSWGAVNNNGYVKAKGNNPDKLATQAVEAYSIYNAIMKSALGRIIEEKYGKLSNENLVVGVANLPEKVGAAYFQGKLGEKMLEAVLCNANYWDAAKRNPYIVADWITEEQLHRYGLDERDVREVKHNVYTKFAAYVREASEYAHLSEEQREDIAAAFEYLADNALKEKEQIEAGESEAYEKAA